LSLAENQSGVVGKNHSGISSGMWLLLFLELVVFGGILISFFVFRMLHVSDFLIASRQLSTLLGTLNTILLLTGSLTIVLSSASLEGKRTSLAVFFQFTTLLFGLFFLINKYYEYAVNSYFGFYPGSAELTKSSAGQSVFCWLYYLASGFHSLLVFIGVVVLGWTIVSTLKGKMNTENGRSVTSAVLFWNSLTVIGVIIFSMFYLIG
jgi:cytochrome c oxidase subunit III